MRYRYHLVIIVNFTLDVFKGTVHHKKNLASFIHVDQNMYKFLSSAEH